MADPFNTTRWSVVLAAAGSSSEARTALQRLCEVYWYPLYAFVRRRGFSPEEAQDVTQAYFAALMEDNVLAGLDAAKGRFRAFLLASIKNFISKERERARAQKRQGDLERYRVPLQDAENRYAHEPVDSRTPDQLFEQRWALLILKQAMERLGSEFEADGKGRRFEALRGSLTGGADRSLKQIAADLGLGESAVKVQLHRARKRLGALLREEVAQTVSDDAEIDSEVRHLLRVVSG